MKKGSHTGLPFDHKDSPSLRMVRINIGLDIRMILTPLFRSGFLSSAEKLVEQANVLKEEIRKLERDRYIISQSPPVVSQPFTTWFMQVKQCYNFMFKGWKVMGSHVECTKWMGYSTSIYIKKKAGKCPKPLGHRKVHSSHAISKTQKKKTLQEQALLHSK